MWSALRSMVIENYMQLPSIYDSNLKVALFEIRLDSPAEDSQSDKELKIS